MKVLHIFPFTVFAINYIKGFEEYPNHVEHIFWLYGSQATREERKITFSNTSNIIQKEDQFEELELVYNSCDIFVIQCIPENLKLYESLYHCFINNPKPFVIVPWGREVFKESDLYKFGEKTVIDQIDKYKSFFIEKCSYMVVSKWMFSYIEKHYKTKSKHSYFNCLNGFLIDDYSKEMKKNEVKKGILVGHRGTITSGHLEVLHRMEKWKKKIDIVLCPLVYGNPDYIEEVEKSGQELFGEQWKSIRKWMDKKEYYNYLEETIDIAVFNTNASEGNNTVFFLIYAGKKVYVNKNSELYWVLKELNLEFYEWNQNMEEEVFFEPLTEEQVKHNRTTMEQFGNMQIVYGKWREIFDFLYKIENN
ncbi:hypothetical protein D3Z58_21775 [Clostridiaceae bacterium]|nr:hypothetical protein [Clostridiaceae bacterium]